jgi:hypothetical protein
MVAAGNVATVCVPKGPSLAEVPSVGVDACAPPAPIETGKEEAEVIVVGPVRYCPAPPPPPALAPDPPAPHLQKYQNS